MILGSQVRNYDLLTHSLTRVKSRDASASKKILNILSTPMMELASVMVDVMVMLVPKEGMTQEKRLINRGGHYAPIIRVFLRGHLENIMF